MDYGDVMICVLSGCPDDAIAEIEALEQEAIESIDG